MAYPIIVVHNGNQEYLKICLNQAHFSNPDSRIILLGNGEYKAQDMPFVEFFEASKYFDSANEFEKIYRHYSVNTRYFELLCFQRWFIIKDFIKEQNIQKFLHIDSDVLLYSDFTKETEFINEIKKYDFTMSSCSAHTSFFNSQNIIERLCEYISNTFKDDEFFAQFEKEPNNPRVYNIKNPNVSLPKPLSDMTLLYFFSKESLVNCLDTSCTYDIGVSDDNTNNRGNDTFSALGCIKNIIFDNQNKPMVFHIKKNSVIKMHSLHMQGWLKTLMKKYATYNLKGQIWQIPYNEFDLQLIYSLKMKNTKKHRSKKRVVFNLLRAIVPIGLWPKKLKDFLSEV